MNAERLNTMPRSNVHNTEKKLFGKKRKTELSEEDKTILAALEKLKADLDLIHDTLDEVDDPVLIDSFIFEMNAKNMRYKYYLNLCKEKGLVGDLF